MSATFSSTGGVVVTRMSPRCLIASRRPTAERQREQDKEAWGTSRPERERRLMVDIWYK